MFFPEMVNLSFWSTGLQVQNKDLSVIIPALNEEKTLRGCLDSVKKLDPLEVIVVDGGSADRTKEIAADNGAFVIESRRGRGVQMNAGASIAKGKVLLFLHADTQMPEMKKSFASAAPNSYAGGFFHLKFDDDSMSTKLVEAFANMRARLLSLPYGDQAIFLKETFSKRWEDSKNIHFLKILILQ